MPKEFTVNDFSIVAAQKYEIEKDDAYDVYLKDSLEDTAIRAFFVGNDEVKEWGYEGDMSSKEYAENFVATELLEWNEEDIVEIDDTHTMVHMVTNANNDSVYNMKVVTKTEGGFWIAEFTCYEEYYSDYYDTFINYAGTIK